MKKLSFLWACLFLSLLFTTDAFAAVDNSTRIFNPRFQTLRLSRTDDPLSLPVITLNGKDTLTLSFDEIGDDYSDNLQYSITHCNADWQPSRLIESEYLDGFNYIDIDDYAFSSNTYIHYVNYSVRIPSPDLQIKMSGNYILKVFPRENPDDTILQARFRVTEQTAAISGFTSGRTDRGINTNWQQLDFKVSVSPTEVQSPLSDLIVMVTQNDRPETTRRIMRPMRQEGSTLVYSHIPELIFNAGNEYRRFETVRNDYPGMGVDSIRYIAPNYHAFLSPDYARTDSEYSYDCTQHGRFMIDEYNSTDPNLGADYITVHFALDLPEINNAEIYVEGDLALRRFDERNKMKYNPYSGRYELALPLKQGSYNYQYVIKTADGKTFTHSPIEGDFSDTSNVYTVDVYLRTPSSRGDRLIGSANILSTP
ncbi:MAG: DUF5103 domain-containing protein [Muribaculaceae bacterium]|nr:DUF5103 domain-containing protein [Muribaculaceae bacterium]